MKRTAVVLAVLVMMVGNPALLFSSSAGVESWEPYCEVKGGALHAYDSGDIVRDGDRTRVRSRAVEVPESGKRRVTTILYEIDCRQRTFRTFEVVEEQGGERSI